MTASQSYRSVKRAIRRSHRLAKSHKSSVQPGLAASAVYA